MRRNVFPKFIEIFYGDAMLVPTQFHLDGRQHGGPKPAETSVTEFCYTSVNLSLEELKA